jgi:hypothetical protein
MTSPKEEIGTRAEFDFLHAGELRKGVKMRVAGAEDKRMLQDERRDPHIVGWDGSALFAQLPVKGGVMMRGLFIGIEHADAGLH